jgi:hypothetical protein
MTRCVCCDKKLKDHEAVRRHAITNDFLDICDVCLKDIPNIPTKLPKGVVIEADPFEDSEANDVDLEDVTNCYTLDLDKD